MRQSIRSISMYVAAFEELSFTKAAAREHATQSGVSQHVGFLEESLGVRLFNRGVGALSPTPAGIAYYSACIDFLKSHERTLRSVAIFKDGAAGEITVGLTPVMTRYVLAPAYAKFTASNPNVTVRVIDSYFGNLTDRVRSGELTFAVVPAAASSKGVRTSLFARSPELLVSGIKSALKDHEPVRLSDLRPLNLIVPGRANARRQMIDAYLSSNDTVPNGLLEFDTMAGSLDLVRQSEWSVIYPLVMMAGDIGAGSYTINPITGPDFMLDLFLFQPARKPMPDAAVSFLQCLHEEMESIGRVHTALNPQA